MGSTCLLSPFGDVASLLELKDVMVVQHCDIPSATEWEHFKMVNLMICDLYVKKI